MHESDADSSGNGTQFGYYPHTLELRTKRFSISTMAGLSDTVYALTNCKHTIQGWIYPGPVIHYDPIEGKRTMPFPARLFDLPKTHILTLFGDQDKNRIDFLLWCISFLQGMRLTSMTMAYLDATPLTPGALHDFAMTQDEREEAINRCINFYDRSTNPATLKRMAAAIHALFIAQNPKNFPFERFQYFYMALDTCFKLTKDLANQKPPQPHSLRIKWMCDYFSMPVPWWAQSIENSKATPLSTVRNDTIHEGLFFGEPLGFSRYGGKNATKEDNTVTMEMRNIICRLLIAILGMPEARYVRTKPDRYRHGLGLLTKPF